MSLTSEPREQRRIQMDTSKLVTSDGDWAKSAAFAMLPYIES